MPGSFSLDDARKLVGCYYACYDIPDLVPVPPFVVSVEQLRGPRRLLLGRVGPPGDATDLPIEEIPSATEPLLLPFEL